MVFVRSLRKYQLFYCTIFCLAILLLSSCASPDTGNTQANKTPTATPIDLTPCTTPDCGTTTSRFNNKARPFIDTWSGIHLFQSFDYRIHDPTSIARYYDFIWGVTPNKVQAFRAGNANVFLSYYIPFHRDGGTFLSQDVGKQHDLNYWKNFHSDWILYQCDRTTPAQEYGDPNIPLDFSNPAIINWQIQTYGLPASQNGYDAIAADNLNMENLFGACGFYRNGQWVQRYTGNVSDPQWRADIATWVTRMQAALHVLSHPLALIPNLGIGKVSYDDPSLQQVISHVDGILDESGFTNYGSGYVTGNSWVQYTNFIRTIQQQHKPYYIVNEFSSDTPNSAEIAWAVASYLMAKDHLASLFISHTQAYGADLRYPQYSLPIGSPKGNVYESQGVYWRDYSGGLVVVNPSSTDSFTVKTSASTYVDYSGKHISQTFTLPPHSGMVLIPG